MEAGLGAGPHEQWVVLTCHFTTNANKTLQRNSQGLSCLKGVRFLGLPILVPKWALPDEHRSWKQHRKTILEKGAQRSNGLQMGWDPSRHVYCPLASFPLSAVLWLLSSLVSWTLESTHRILPRWGRGGGSAAGGRASSPWPWRYWQMVREGPQSLDCVPVSQAQQGGWKVCISVKILKLL